jgi:recombination protein RecA
MSELYWEKELLDSFTAPRAPRHNLPGIPTGSLSLDSSLSHHGWPRNRVSQLWAEAAVGKSTMAYHAIAEAQKLGLSCALADVRNELQPRYAEALGVDLEQLWVACHAPPRSWQKLPVDLLVVDNLDSYDAYLMMLAAGREDLTVLVTSPQIGQTVPDIRTAAVRVALRLVGTVSEGLKVAALVHRDDSGIPLRSERVPSWKIHYGQGIDHADELLTLGLEVGLISKEPGQWYHISGKKFARGKKNALAGLRDHHYLATCVERDIKSFF